MNLLLKYEKGPINNKKNEINTPKNQTYYSICDNSDNWNIANYVMVKNKHVELDKIDSQLINEMNENEKKFYVNICRELYSFIYDRY